MSYLTRLRAQLAQVDADHRRRTVRNHLPAHAVDFSSNDYLGLAHDPRVLTALHNATSAGSGGSRLLGGAHPEHTALETALAEWTNRPSARLYSSGYLAAIGAMTALAAATDVAYSDERNHACIIDGLRLTKLDRHIVPHATVPNRSTDPRPALLVTESIFGMDGAHAPLAQLIASLREADVLAVDEAHALGITGPAGSGLASAHPDDRVVIIGTLSKAVGASGGFIAGPTDLIDWLTSRGRTFIFDTAPPPAIAAAASQALAIVQSPEGDALRERLHATATRVRTELRTLGYDIPGESGPVVPLLLGDERTALALMANLETRGLYVPAIRPPTVPPGSSRLRITLRADHTPAHIDALLLALRDHAPLALAR
jgi:8-amino-7-oxononanoate synthase